MVSTRFSFIDVIVFGAPNHPESGFQTRLPFIDSEAVSNLREDPFILN